MVRLCLLLAAVLFTLNACTPVTDNVELAPARYINPVQTDSLGEGRAVNLTVEDLRDSPILGPRSADPNEPAQVTLGNNPQTVITQALSNALIHYNFKPAVDVAASRGVTVELKKLSYHPQFDGINTQVTILAVIQVKATNQGRTFESSYRSEHTFEQMFSVSTNKNTQVINQVFGQALNQIIHDKRLIKFLAE